jgi:hypothetical protein
MTTFYVADGLVVFAEKDEWRLAVERSDSPTLFLAQRPAEVVRYHPEFGRARRLGSSDGELPVTDIAEVVVGWSQADAAWHLGLLLSGPMATRRGGRWCALARWAGGFAEGMQARESGQHLAGLLGKRFRFVDAPETPIPVGGAEPSDVSQEADTEPVQEIWTQPGTLSEPAERVPAPPPDLPLRMGNWRLRAIDIGYQWEHTGVWSLGVLWSVFGRIALGIAFVVVSVLTLQSPYAAVQPTLLPYAGVAIGAGLIVAALAYTMRLLRVEAVVVDTEERQVRRHLDLTSDVISCYEFDEIRAVVVTQIAQGGKQRGRNGQPDRMAHEAWLHLLLDTPRAEPGKAREFKPEDAYVIIGYVESTEGDVIDAHFEGKRGARQPRLLSARDATTPVGQAAILLADAIGVSAYIDQR